MFLERKFMSPDERSALLTIPGLPERVQDVVRNLEHLLAAERGVGHLLPDYGLSHSGHWSVEGVIAHASAELRQNLARYEARLVLEDLEAELDDDGRPLLLVVGRVGDARVTLTVDPLRRRVHAVQLG